MAARMDGTRRVLEARRGGDSPLVAIQQFVEVHGLPDPIQVKRLSQELALPEAAVRGTLSYYSDLHESSEAARICIGTSCVLAGCKDLLAAASKQTPCRGVYCVGFCDRSPAALRSDNRVVALNGNASVEPLLELSVPEPARPIIRSVANQTDSDATYRPWRLFRSRGRPR